MKKNERLQLEIGGSLHGKSLGRALTKLRPDLAYRDLQRAARRRRVLLNGRPAKLGALVRKGDAVELRIRTGPMPNPAVRCRVALETPFLIVADKPSGVAVLPGPGHWRSSLVSGLLCDYPELAALGEDGDWGLAHRLDRVTSGLVAVGRSRSSLQHLRAEFRQRRVEKVYLALCPGQLAESGEVRTPLAERRCGDQLRAVASPGGRPSVTRFRVLARAGGTSLLEVAPETGRFHQIRAHLASLGFPIAGDPLYGNPERNRFLEARTGLARIFLHAARLVLSDIEGERRAAGSPLPPELQEVLGSLGYELDQEKLSGEATGHAEG